MRIFFLRKKMESKTGKDIAHTIPPPLQNPSNVPPLQCAYGIVMTYSSPELRNVSLAWPSNNAESELPVEIDEYKWHDCCS